MKVWITQYALTQGIMEREVERTEVSPHMVCCLGRQEYYHGDDWHLTRESAVKRAERMRKAKLVSLRKSIERLESLRWEPSEED